MATPQLDPNLPADNALIVSGELRTQFQAIQDRFDMTVGVDQLGLTVSNPPTQAEMQALADKLDQVITALHGG
jgi:hypothetical protein